MKPARRSLVLTVLLLGVILLTAHPAKALIGFSASATPNPVAVSNTVTYTFNFTNTTILPVNDIFITNQLSFNFTNVPPGWVNLNSNTMVLPFGTLPPGSIIITNYGFTPVILGVVTNLQFLTNAVTMIATGETNYITNLVTRVAVPQGDLGVSISAPATGILVDDQMIVDITITNRGPETVPHVLLTNMLAPSFKLIAPTNLAVAYSNGNLNLNLGSLASGGLTNLHLVLQPTNSGPFTFDSLVTAASLMDTNLADNIASTNITIGSFLTNPGEITVTNLSQRFDYLTGLLQVRFRLTNTTTNDVPAARVLTSNLPTGARLYNASGTNSGSGFALYNASLAAGASVDLVLEFYVLKVAAFTNYIVTAFGVPPVNLSASTNASVAVTSMAYGPGGFLIKFPATIGKTYTVLYSDAADFSNAQTSQPSIVAGGTQVQWIDNGPPKTAPPPTSGRFYRVIQND
jgi:hypothetical protein